MVAVLTFLLRLVGNRARARSVRRSRRCRRKCSQEEVEEDAACGGQPSRRGRGYRRTYIWGSKMLVGASTMEPTES